MNRDTASIFLEGMIFGSALVYSVISRQKYPSFFKWWDAEGVPLWLGSGFLIAMFYFL